MVARFLEALDAYIPDPDRPEHVIAALVGTLTSFLQDPDCLTLDSIQQVRTEAQQGRFLVARTRAEFVGRAAVAGLQAPAYAACERAAAALELAVRFALPDEREVPSEIWEEERDRAIARLARQLDDAERDLESVEEAITAVTQAPAAPAPHPDAGADPAAVLTINDRMLATTQRLPQSITWSAREWARHLGCSSGTVCGTPTWGALEQARAAAQAERRGRALNGATARSRRRSRER